MKNTHSLSSLLTVTATASALALFTSFKAIPSEAKASDSSTASNTSATVKSSTLSSVEINEQDSSSKLTKQEKKELKVEQKLLGKEKEKDGAATTADDRAAPCVSWVDPLVKPKACLLCIHGLGLYSGSYEDFGKWMARRGVGTYAIDVRGFGSWMQVKGDDDIDFAACLKDIQKTLKSIRTANPGLPVYILGESMGGAISLKAAALYPDLIDGLISSVPAGSRFKQKKTDIKVALEFLTGPNKQHNMGKSVVSQATENDKLRKDWEGDPMDRMQFSAKQLMQFQKFMNENHDAAKLISKSPVLVLQGSEDKLVKPEGTWELFSEIESADKTFLAVPSEHLIFEEQQDHAQKFDERVSRLVMTWLQTHLPTGYKWVEGPEHTDHSTAMVRLLNNDFAGAKKELDAAIAGGAADGRTYFLRGIAENKLNMPLKAKADFAKAMELGKGSDSAKNANEYMLGMLQPSKASQNTSTSAPAEKIVLTQDLLQPVGAFGQPAILAFYASWAEQCKDIDKVANTTGILPKGIKFVKVDIEDAHLAPLVQACNVGPIPTFVFVQKNGTVASISIGMNNFTGFAKQLKLAPSVPVGK
ncbi:MAG TPA: alpha/beta fold hydrolase [Oculatellaceae cyanobacterium]